MSKGSGYQSSKGKGKAVDTAQDDDDEEGVEFQQYGNNFPYTSHPQAEASTAIEIPLRPFDRYVPVQQQPPSQLQGLEQPQINEDVGEEILKIMLSSEEALDLPTMGSSSTPVETSPSSFPYYQGTMPFDASGIPFQPSADPSSLPFGEAIRTSVPWVRSSSHSESLAGIAPPQYFRSLSSSSEASYSTAPSISPIEGSTSQAYTGAPFGSPPIPYLPSTSSKPINPEASSYTTFNDPLARRQSGRSSESDSTIPACDTCRRRKVKCDRQQPVCGFCARLNLPCTTKDTLRKRGPPTRAKKIAMSAAGFVYDRGRRRWRALEPDETIDIGESLEQEEAARDTTGQQSEDAAPPSSESSQSSSQPAPTSR